MKVFTPQSAAKTLPLVKKIVEEILGQAKIIRSLMEQKNDPGILDQIEALQEEVKGLMLELEEIGCHFKDWNFEIGLVDFPAVINGQDVMLCWRSDEKNIRWYHGHEDGFSGRKLIPEDVLEQ